MRIAIATDAWFPQVNGVVRSLATTVSILNRRGHEVELITPEQFLTVPMPGYREIRLAITPRFRIRRALRAFKPEIVHIVTEGPIGWSARAWCIANDVPFTTAFHTRFPDYAAVRTGLSPDRFWPIMRKFHSPSRAVLASTVRLMDELAGRGIHQTRLWSRGIDRELFHPNHAPLPEIAELPKPIMLSVGRIAAEKNLEAFLCAPVAGSKVVIGDGPALKDLQERFPQAHFLGAMHGEALARAYCSADVFVFPSLTDTFGLVIIEALACGTPVAAFPVQGPIDILGPSSRGMNGQLDTPAGALDESLPAAIIAALDASPQAAAKLGTGYDWEKCSDQFLATLSEASLGASGQHQTVGT